MALYHKTDYDYINTAATIAAKAHNGQVDKGNGLPYILHPLFVVTMVHTPEQKAAAMLHDVLEDTDTTVDDLLAAGIPARVVDLVCLLTDPKDGDFEGYINNLVEDFDAAVVKQADLEDNISRQRGRGLNDEIRSKIYKGLKIIEDRWPELRKY